MDKDNKKYLLVIGSRSFTDYKYAARILDKVVNGYKDIVIVSGGADGADALAKRYATEKGFEYIEFPADWKTYGKSAGYIRNEEMHKYIAQYETRKVIAFWDGVSKGTAHSFKLAEKYNNQLHVIRVKKDEEICLKTGELLHEPPKALESPLEKKEKARTLKV